MSNLQTRPERLDPSERLALVTLRTAHDAVRVAIQACMAADFGTVFVLSPLELIERDLAGIIRTIDAAPQLQRATDQRRGAL